MYQTFYQPSNCINSLPLDSNQSLSLPTILLLNTMPHISIKFLWIPSHIGITHNEKVDSLAKDAIRSGNPHKYLPISKILRVAKQSSFDDWSLHYPKSFKNPKSSYLLIQPQLPRTPSYTHCNDLRRSFIIKLSRLRFGHNRLPQHHFRIGLIDSSYCPLLPQSHTIFILNLSLIHISEPTRPY